MGGHDFLVWAGFRTHILLPHDVVGTIVDGEPTWPGLNVERGVYRRRDAPVLQVETHAGPKLTRVTVRALREVWIQEPGLAVKIAGGGTWRGFGPTGDWTRTTAGVDGPLPLHQKDAHVATVHWSRVRTNPDYTVGVEYRQDTGGSLPSPSQEPARYRFVSDGGFTKLLEHAPGVVPWQHCQVFGRDWRLTGVYEVGKDVARRKWELAGAPPDIGQFYAFGWVGGPGAVVNAAGRTPTPGAVITEEDAYDRLFDPWSWRRLRPGHEISQTLSARRLAA